MDCTKCDGIGWRWVPDKRGSRGWAWAFCSTCQGTGTACVRARAESDRPPRVKPRPELPPADVLAMYEEGDAA